MMFLWEFDGEFSEDFSSISLKSGIECSITINNNETKRRFIEKKFFLEIIKIEFRLTAINGEIDGFERFKVNNNFLLTCGILIHNSSCEYDNSIFRGLIEIFKSFPCRSL